MRLSGSERFPSGWLERRQQRIAADMEQCVPAGTPLMVRQSIMEKVYDRLLHPCMPSLKLQHEITMQHLASVNELGDALAKHTTEQPQKMRSAIALSAAPASSSNASLREYEDWTHFDRYVCMCVCVCVCI